MLFNFKEFIKYVYEQTKKKFFIRLSFLSFVVAIYLLFDELLKENYFFKYKDLFYCNLTYPKHECFILISFLIAIISFITHTLKNKKK